MKLHSTPSACDSFRSHAQSTCHPPLCFFVLFCFFPSLVTYLITAVVSFCCFPRFVLIHLASPLKVDEEGGKEGGSGDRRASQRASAPFINIRISIAALRLKSQLGNPCSSLEQKQTEPDLNMKSYLSPHHAELTFSPSGAQLHEFTLLSEEDGR